MGALHAQGPEISWRQLMCKLLGLPSDTIFYDNLLEMISERIGCPSRTEALVQLGLLSEEKVERLGTPLDTVSNHLASILSYDSEERDMILMRHEVIIKCLITERRTVASIWFVMVIPKDIQQWLKRSDSHVQLLQEWFWIKKFKRQAWFFPSPRTSTDQ